MVAFVTLCDTYIGIEPPLNLWSHFFRTQLWHDLGARAASLGSVDHSVGSGPGADSYYSIPQPNPPIGWQKAWFLLKGEADAPLPMFTGSYPNWENRVAQANSPPITASAGDRPGVTTEGIDRRGDYVDFPLPWGSAASPARGSCGDVSGAKLFRSPHLFPTE
jgi:hypothetical protein